MNYPIFCSGCVQLSKYQRRIKVLAKKKLQFQNATSRRVRNFPAIIRRIASSIPPSTRIAIAGRCPDAKTLGQISGSVTPVPT